MICLQEFDIVDDDDYKDDSFESGSSNGEISQDQSGDFTKEKMKLFIQLQSDIVLPSQLE